jgi:hypothetical protein
LDVAVDVIAVLLVMAAVCFVQMQNSEFLGVLASTKATGGHVESTGTE